MITWVFRLVAFKDLNHGKVFKKLLQTPDFRVNVIKDVTNAELCGALKVLQYSKLQYVMWDM